MPRCVPHNLVLLRPVEFGGGQMMREPFLGYLKGIGSSSARLIALSLQSKLALKPESISPMKADGGWEKWRENIPQTGEVVRH